MEAAYQPPSLPRRHGTGSGPQRGITGPAQRGTERRRGVALQRQLAGDGHGADGLGTGGASDRGQPSGSGGYQGVVMFDPWDEKRFDRES